MNIFRKYTNEIDNTRNGFPLFFNFKLKQVLCIERANIGYADEKTIVTLDFPNGQGLPVTEWSLQISRSQHSLLVTKIMNHGKEKTLLNSESAVGK